MYNICIYIHDENIHGKFETNLKMFRKSCCSEIGDVVSWVVTLAMQFQLKFHGVEIQVVANFTT